MRLIDTGEDAGEIEAPLEEDELEILDTFARHPRRGDTSMPERAGNIEEESSPRVNAPLLFERTRRDQGSGSPTGEPDHNPDRRDKNRASLRRTPRS